MAIRVKAWWKPNSTLLLEETYLSFWNLEILGEHGLHFSLSLFLLNTCPSFFFAFLIIFFETAQASFYKRILRNSNKNIGAFIR